MIIPLYSHRTNQRRINTRGNRGREMDGRRPRTLILSISAPGSQCRNEGTGTPANIDNTTSGSLLLNRILEASKIGIRGPAHLYITHLTTPMSHSMQLNIHSSQQAASHYNNRTEPKTGNHTLAYFPHPSLSIFHDHPASRLPSYMIGLRSCSTALRS